MMAKCVAPGSSLWISELVAPLCQSACAPFMLHVTRCFASGAVEGEARYFAYCNRLVPLLEEVAVPLDVATESIAVVHNLRPIAVGEAFMELVVLAILQYILCW